MRRCIDCNAIITSNPNYMRIEELLDKPMEKCLSCFIDFLSHIEYLNGVKRKRNEK
jgi:hypothetical protein